MKIYSNVAEQDLINLHNLAEPQKEQRALKSKNRIIKQTHDVKLAETLSNITKKLEDVNKSISESTKQLVKKSDIVDEIIQTPGIENITGTQSLRDTLTLMKKSKISLSYKKTQMEKYFGIKSPLHHKEKIELVLKVKSLI